jgi:hypothetical protein
MGAIISMRKKGKGEKTSFLPAAAASPSSMITAEYNRLISPQCLEMGDEYLLLVAAAAVAAA